MVQVEIIYIVGLLINKNFKTKINMTNFFWSVYQLDTVPMEGNLMDVVITVHYGRTAVEGEYTAYSYGTMGCATPSETDFTAYPDLTFEQVCSWLENGLDTASIDAGLQQDIDNQINPPVVKLALPWIPIPLIGTLGVEVPIIEEPTPEA
jgi:hypothetical protein